jgi:hypothetical protein
LNSKDGKISDVKIHSDSLFPAMVDEIRTNLLSVTYNKEGIESGLQKARQRLEANPDTRDSAKYVTDFQDWLVKSI